MNQHHRQKPSTRSRYTTHKSTSIDALAPQSRFFQGRFGRIASDLEAWTPPGIPEAQIDAFFLDIANTLMTERPGEDPADLLEITPELEAEFQSGEVGDVTTGIPAGYTYFGQFVDHDVTFDSASSLERRNDPQAIDNVRTPRLDLDNVYGRGVADQPYMFDEKGMFLTGTVAGSTLRDLPRNPDGIAIIGDKRNDENAIVSQLQLAFLLAHNTLQQRAVDADMDNPHEAARKTLRWLYQWVVWNDFLRRVCNNAVHDAALTLESKPCGGVEWELGFDHIYKWRDQPFMPVEFSVAAYRFGHTMVRNAYQTNFPHRGFGVFAPIFDNTAGTTGDDLRGFPCHDGGEFDPMGLVLAHGWPGAIPPTCAHDRHASGQCAHTAL